MTEVAGKKALVTGAASGIGRATALELARREAKLVLTDIQEESLAAAARECEAAGGEVLVAEAFDISDHAAVTGFADRVQAEHGSLDLVLNVAGISTWGSVERLSHEDWRRNLAINLGGPISVIEAFIPPMIEAGRGGHLVNVSSAAGLLGLPWHAAYSAAKFGLRGVSEVLRFDLRRHGIGVSLVCPGGVDTGLVETINIVGVDTGHPTIVKMRKRFQRHAKSPEQVAKTIVAGIERDRYLVYTSLDIRLAFLLQRWFPPGYELIMRLLNDRLIRITAKATSQ